MKTKNRILLLTVAGALATLPASAATATFTNLYAFGDSLTDVGNVHLATAGARPGPGYFNGLGIDIRLLDIFGIGEELHSTPAAFGITNLTEGALTSGHAADAAQYAYWDTVHPTSAVHNLFGERAYLLVRNRPRWHSFGCLAPARCSATRGGEVLPEKSADGLPARHGRQASCLPGRSIRQATCHLTRNPATPHAPLCPQVSGKP